jgi:uncharacterized protein (TIGR03382 family)
MLTLLIATQALALDCDTSDQVLPAAAATDIATSASIVVRSPFSEDTRTFKVTDPSGAEVTTTIESSLQGSSNLLRITPDAAFAADTVFTLTAGDGDTQKIDVSFTTGTDADTTAPTGLTLGDVNVYSVSEEESDWGEERALGASVSGATDDDPITYEWQFSESDDFASPTEVTSIYESALFGKGLCDHTVDPVPLDTPIFIRVRAVDLSGNASDWLTYDDSYTIPSDGGDTGDTGDTSSEEETGCSAVGGAGMSLSWLSIGLLGFIRRRR